jgi:FkbM family methyltransferase
MSLAKSISTRRRTRIYRDTDGDWIQAHRDAVIACPDVHLKRLESVERKAERFWFRHYRPLAGDAIIDAGAGIGEDAIVFSRAVTPSGRVIALEPSARVFRCLQKTVRLSELTNVVLRRCALHSRDSELKISSDSHYAAGTVLDPAGGEGVPARSLDSLCEELGLERIDLLKMNIEGAEADALDGMVASWQVVRNVVISCHDFLADRGASPKFRTRSRVVALLEARGFRILPSHDDAPEDWARGYVYAAAP